MNAGKPGQRIERITALLQESLAVAVKGGARRQSSASARARRKLLTSAA